MPVDELKNYTFENNMNILMGETPDDVDKRQGGLFFDIYTAVAHFGTLIFSLMSTVYNNFHPATAQGVWLDRCADDVGLKRIEATNAVKRAYIYDREGNLIDLDLGTFIAPVTNPSLYYSLVEKESVGIYKARCTTVGTVGNSYIGQCSSLSNLTTIGQVMMTDLIESARNEETDDELRARIKEASNATSFGGNIAQYRALVGTELTTVGQMQVYPRNITDPIYNGITISVVDNENNIMSAEALDIIKQLLDPIDFSGEGRGLVPMDHSIVVVTPTELTVNFSMSIVVKTGYDAESVKNNIVEKLREFIDEIKDVWADIDYTSEDLYYVSINISNAIAKCVAVEGVERVNNLLINNQSTDLELIETKALQQLPKFGEVTFTA